MEKRPAAHIHALHSRIERLEGRASCARLALPFGVPQIDRRLPGDGLVLGTLHEMEGGGFYAPTQIVRDARDHGVETRSVCTSAGRWNCTLEPIMETNSGKPVASTKRLVAKQTFGIAYLGDQCR